MVCGGGIARKAHYPTPTISSSPPFFGFFQGLPQLAEKKTPQPTDAVGEYVL